MLAGTGQLVEEGRFAAVLIPNQSESQYFSIRQRVSGTFRMKLALLAQAGVCGFLGALFCTFFGGCILRRNNSDPKGLPAELVSPS